MTTRPSRSLRKASALGALLVLVPAMGVAGIMLNLTHAGASTTTITLATAGSASVIGGSTVTNTGPSVLNLDLDLSPGSAVTGFPPGTVGGAIHVSDGVANQAQSDLTTAYNQAVAAGSTVNQTGVPLGGGETLTQGVYTASTSMQLNGQLTLNGDASSVFIFQAGSTLTTASASSVVLTGGMTACNVFWQVGTSATIGTTTAFAGSILALTSVTLNTGATVVGRALARNGAVTMDTNVFSGPACNGTLTLPPPTTTATTAPATTATPTTVAGTPTTIAGAGTPTTLGTGLPTSPLAFTSGPTPAVVGPPHTGGAPLPGAPSPWLTALMLALLSGAGATACGLGLRARRSHRVGS